MNLVSHIKKNKPFCHFSVDDVYRIFTNRKTGFKFLKSLYEDYGVVTTLNVFSAPQGKKILPKVKSCAMKDAPWLRYGPHAPEWEKPFNTLVIEEQIKEIDHVFEEIDRIAGPDKRAKTARLHMFKGSKEASLHLKKHGVDSLFTQNYHDTRTSYHLPSKSLEHLNNRGFFYDKDTGMHFIKTQIGIEFQPQIKKDVEYFLGKHNFVVFTHEEHLTDKLIQNRIRRVLDIGKSRGISNV